MNRTLAPEIKKINRIHTGFPIKPGGINKIYSEEGVFKLEIVYPKSSYGNAENKFISLMTMDLILSGTKDFKANEIADAIDFLGGFVFKSSDYYNASVTLYGLNENLSKILSITRKSIENCHFDPLELSIHKAKKVSELKINLDKTSFLANRRINQKIFGIQHPNSSPSTPNSYNEISREQLVAYKNDHLKNPYFIFTGSQNTPIEEILQKEGFTIDEQISINNADRKPVPEKAEDFVQKKGSTQNSLRIGKIMPSREHPDYFKISLLNLILGGYFGSRLMKNIREEKGLTYGIHSNLSPFKTYSLFKISCECNNKLTDEVKKEIEKEILHLQSHLVAPDELEVARNYMSGAMLRNFDGAFNISERYKTFLELNTAENYYTDYFHAINNITAEEIREAANNYLDLNTLEYCIAGEI